MFFYLFRLDLLARENVLELLDPFELFTLSLCSKRSYNYVQTSLRRTSSFYSIDIHLSTDHYNIGVDCDINDYHVGSFSCQAHQTYLAPPFFAKIGGKDVIRCFREHPTGFNTYWRDPVEGFMILIDYITRLYRRPVDILYLDDTDPRKAVEILKFINDRQDFIQYGHVDLEKVYDEMDLSGILDQLARVKELELKISPGLDFFDNDIRTYQFDQLDIEEAYWVNLPRLLNMNCGILRFGNTKLSHLELNCFLKTWIQGKGPEIKDLGLEMVDLDLQKILTEINHKEHQTGTEGPDKKYHLEGYSNIWEIQSKDGKIAFIRQDDNYFSMKIKE